MMTGNSNPSIDPADNDSLAGTIRFAFSKLLQSVDGLLPAQIIEYNRDTNRASVQPLIMITTTDGSKVSRAQIASVPVLQIGGGGFLLNFNLKAGDLGYLLSNDRDISLFTQSYAESPANTVRVKNFSDAIFIPHVMMGYTIAEEDAENAVLQNLDGTIKISLGLTKIKLMAPMIECDGDLVVNGGLIATGGIISGSASPLLVTGDLRVEGDITASGSITGHVP